LLKPGNCMSSFKPHLLFQILLIFSSEIGVSSAYFISIGKGNPKQEPSKVAFPFLSLF
jgi:hypothetical protein